MWLTPGAGRHHQTPGVAETLSALAQAVTALIGSQQAFQNTMAEQSAAVARMATALGEGAEETTLKLTI